ncbi:LysR family transcriptional regulator [Ornithinibacillus gellani]|uniref:LysR family transcriptional regulator n=1 Tax=Ornithinibacillus gellani TaxID=2293253 RepID=UPI000F46D1B7|nr:LysR family transcriptional regulator [Ornithinibacillus gellani]TQS71002.1 LysR family transcriptional regulator [Ornithinibacillus gellani]
MDQQLLVFATVAEKSNFSRAAEELHMTQPAVSQYIRTFEQQIGTRLMERTNKYVRLNKAGEIVYHHAKEILGLYSRMQYLVDDLMHKAEGRLSIGASYTFGEYVLPGIIAALEQRFPNIEATATIGNTEKIAGMLSAQQLDVGIVEGGIKDVQLQEEYLADDTMVITAPVGHPELPANNQDCLHALENQRWIIRESGSGTREATEKLFKQLGISPSKCITFSSTQSIKEAVEAGLGISLLSKWALKKELSRGEMRVLQVPGLPFKREFSVLTNSPFRTKAMDVFLELLHQSF